MKTCFETEAQGNSEMPQLEVSFGVESSFNAPVSIKEATKSVSAYYNSLKTISIISWLMKILQSY